MTDKELLKKVVNQLKDFHCITCFHNEEYGKSDLYRQNRGVLDIPEIKAHFTDNFIL